MSVRFIIIEDDAGVRRMLENIIQQYKLGIVVAACDNGLDGEKSIQQYQPDIAIIDLLLPLQDGLAIVRNIHQAKLPTSVIMISKSNTAEFISEAYQLGIEFFIHKPINVSEVTAVIAGIRQKRQLQHLINTISQTTAQYSAGLSLTTQPTGPPQDKLKNLFSELGILSDRGTTDIAQFIAMIQSRPAGSYHLVELYAKLADAQSSDANTIKQRIRRTVTKALHNIALLGADDYYNDTFQLYSARLFDFKEVRLEIDYINRKSQRRGKVNVKKFMEELIFLSE